LAKKLDHRLGQYSPAVLSIFRYSVDARRRG
jgi:hypothetical protein